MNTRAPHRRRPPTAPASSRFAARIGRWCLLWLLVLGMGPGWAASPDWQPAVWNDFPVRLHLSSTAELELLLQRVPVASFQREQIVRTDEGLVFTPRVTAAEAAALRAAGYAFETLPDVDRAGREAAERAWALQDAAPDKLLNADPAAYLTNDQIGTLFTQLQNDYPDLARVVTWGTSVQGRPLWGLVVSDDVQNTEPEPEVRLSSTMHGDEPPDMVMLLNLAQYLVLNYGQPGYEDVTELVDGTEIHILPLHNPDGYAAGTRANANGVDLNRNFPEPVGYHAIQEVENLHFMAYAQAHHFVISQNGHAGALVVNYPWDYTWDLAPDNDAMIDLSLEYSTYNLPMYEGVFEQGITNGAEWYAASGTLQDWSYHVTGGIDVTLEVSLQKWLATTLLPALWEDNRESLMHFVRAARYGLNGVVTDAETGQPLAATVTIAGNAKPVVSDPAHGDYYKLLHTGTYAVTVSAEGYEDLTVPSVAVTWGAATLLDAALHPIPSGQDSVPPPPLLAVRAYPNPFNARLSARCELPAAGRLQLRILDARGRLVRVLIDEWRAAGPQDAVWDGCDESGAAAASGLYFVHAVGGRFETATKVVLAK